jgi:hypothetical protein
VQSRHILWRLFHIQPSVPSHAFPVHTRPFFTLASRAATRLDGHLPRAGAEALCYGCRAKNSAHALMRKVIASSGVGNV